VFLDFAKAFDRVNHKIFLHKLCNFGISGSLVAWCGDYLSNRKQRVVVDGKCSSWLNIPSGVPQGSILGPLFFYFFSSVICLRWSVEKVLWHYMQMTARCLG